MEKRIVFFRHNPEEEKTYLEAHAYLLEPEVVGRVLEELESAGNMEPTYLTIAGSDVRARFCGTYEVVMDTCRTLAGLGWTWERNLGAMAEGVYRYCAAPDCGKGFKRRGKQKYCSRECRWRYNKAMQRWAEKAPSGQRGGGE